MVGYLSTNSIFKLEISNDYQFKFRFRVEIGIIKKISRVGRRTILIKWVELTSIRTSNQEI